MNRYKVAAQIPVMGMKKDLRDAVKYLDEQSEDFLRVMSE